jgi:hypothetical protein
MVIKVLSAPVTKQAVEGRFWLYELAVCAQIDQVFFIPDEVLNQSTEVELLFHVARIYCCRQCESRHWKTEKKDCPEKENLV